MKPVELVERALDNGGRTGDPVLDPFAGSGTTLIACQRRKRRARLIEIDPRYVEVICQRWQQYTGKAAVGLPTGKARATLLIWESSCRSAASRAALESEVIPIEPCQGVPADVPSFFPSRLFGRCAGCRGLDGAVGTYRRRPPMKALPPSRNRRRARSSSV